MKQTILARTPARRSSRRPIYIAKFGAAPAPEAEVIKLPGRVADAPTAAPEPTAKPRLRYDFPAAGVTFEGGTSDGYCYRITFAAGRVERTYEMLRAFLAEHGYGDVPVPASAAELRRFRQPPRLRHQLSFFGDNGYVHNPLRILFPVPAGHRGALCLELYNEAAADHLLRFHRRK